MGIAQNVQKFDIKNETDRIGIAKLAVTSNPLTILRTLRANFEKFGPLLENELSDRENKTILEKMNPISFFEKCLDRFENTMYADGAEGVMPGGIFEIKNMRIVPSAS